MYIPSRVCMHLHILPCSYLTTTLLPETCPGWFHLVNIRTQPRHYLLHIYAKIAFIIKHVHNPGAIYVSHTWMGIHNEDACYQDVAGQSLVTHRRIWTAEKIEDAGWIVNHSLRQIFHNLKLHVLNLPPATPMHSKTHSEGGTLATKLRIVSDMGAQVFTTLFRCRAKICLTIYTFTLNSRFSNQSAGMENIWIYNNIAIYQ